MKRRDTDFLLTKTSVKNTKINDARTRNYFFNDCDTGHLHQELLDRKGKGDVFTIPHELSKVSKMVEWNKKRGEEIIFDLRDER